MDQNSPRNTTLVLPSSIHKSSSQSNPTSPTSDTFADSNLDCAETTPRSKSIGSPTISPTHEYAVAVHTVSFKDTMSNIHSHSPNDLQEEEHNNENKFRPSSSRNHGYSQRARSSSPPSPILSLPHEHSLAFLTNTENHNNHQNQAESSSDYVSQLFHPFREDVNITLNRVIPTNLTRFASAYFDHSERTSHLLCILLESISQAHSLYTPPHSLLNVLSLDSPLSQPQIDLASNVFLQFNIHENPFPLRISQNFQEIILCLSALNQQLRSRLIWNSSSSLYDLTVRGSSVLNDDVNIIDRLVTQLQAVVESDKLMVRTGLERGKDRYPLQEMMEQVRKNRTYFLDNLHDLKSHIYLCFWTLNKVRSLLLSAIFLHEKIRSIAHDSSQTDQTIEEHHNNNQNQGIPSIQALKEVFYRLKPTDFMQLLVTFNLYPFSQSIEKARSLYGPLHDLITILPLDSPLSQSQCNQAYDVILQFNHLENPFDSCISQTLTELKQLLFSFRPSSSSLPRAELILTELKQLLFSSRPSSSSLPRARLDTANKGAHVLKNDLYTIEAIIYRLQMMVEDDKQLIRFLSESGRDRYATEVVIEQLRKHLPNVLKQLMELEEYVFLCSATINRLTSLLLTEILLQERL